MVTQNIFLNLLISRYQTLFFKFAKHTRNKLNKKWYKNQINCENNFQISRNICYFNSKNKWNAVRIINLNVKYLLYKLYKFKCTAFNINNENTSYISIPTLSCVSTHTIKFDFRANMFFFYEECIVLWKKIAEIASKLLTKPQLIFIINIKQLRVLLILSYFYN